MIKQLLLICTFFSFIFSCTYWEETKPLVTYVGGEIVNPKGDYVYFLKDDQLLDSVPLDNNNKFLFKTKDIEAGLYTFSHVEFQVFYLNPGDSLMLRVNTLEFDESLSFTGMGSKSNNFLMDLFLLNEGEIELMPSYYKLPPLYFEKKLDSLKNIRLKIYNDFVQKTKAANSFKYIAEANINYDYFSKKEIYITANERRKGSDSYHNIPQEFYNYRDDINFGSNVLRSYFPYYRFLFRYFDNLAMEDINEKNNSQRNSFSHNYRKIELINRKVINDSLKNNMVMNVTGRYLLNCNKKENQENILNLFLKINTNKNQIKEIKELADASMQLTPGSKISNVPLISSSNKIKKLHSIIHNPTVLYFWSSTSMNHNKNIHSRVADLKSKYPEYDFIGINTDSNYNNWMAIINKSGYKTNLEFQFENVSKSEKELVIHTINKAIIVDKTGTIVNGSANLFNTNIEESLLGYLNQ
jgi:hypothetical protein